jgi:hypothetical protein
VTSSLSAKWRWLVSLSVAVVSLSVVGPAASASDLPEEAISPPIITCLKQLRGLGCGDLEQVFSAAQCGSFPCGLGRGEVLLRTDAKHARMKARMTNRVWKGKYFEEDGHFINQWLGFRALASEACLGPSWLDGLPCVILEYPPDTPVFGNTRDELREVAPGLWLGMWYDREPFPKLRGFFALECRPNKQK